MKALRFPLRTLRFLLASSWLSACSMSTFDDKREQAWSDSNGAVDLQSEDYAVAVAGVTTDRPGTTFAVLGTNPLGLGVVRYDQDGVLQQFGLDLPSVSQLDATAVPTLVGSKDVIGEQNTRVALVAIGALGTRDEILLFDVDEGQPREFATLSGSDCGDPGRDLGTHMSLAFTNAGEPDGLDLIAVRGNQLFLFQDIDPITGESQCFRCDVAIVNEPVRGMATADYLLGDGEDEGDEILVSVNGSLTGLRATHIANAGGGSCFGPSSGSALFAAISSPGGEIDFGDQMVVGDSDDDERPDIAISAPSSGRVYVLQSFDQSNPVASPEPVRLPPDVSSFGTGPMVFLDIEQIEDVGGGEAMEGDELIIGDPDASPFGVDGAGQVYVYRLSEEGEYEYAATLHDSSPEPDQHYGRAVTEAEFIFSEDDADLLVVGAENETFTLFRSLRNGEDPRGE